MEIIVSVFLIFITFLVFIFREIIKQKIKLSSKNKRNKKNKELEIKKDILKKIDFIEDNKNIANYNLDNQFKKSFSFWIYFGWEIDNLNIFLNSLRELINEIWFFYEIKIEDKNDIKEIKKSFSNFGNIFWDYERTQQYNKDIWSILESEKNIISFLNKYK